jgi:hypothetical protein
MQMYKEFLTYANYFIKYFIAWKVMSDKTPSVITHSPWFQILPKLGVSNQFIKNEIP